MPSLRDPSHFLRKRAPPSYEAEGGYGFRGLLPLPLRLSVH